ncbi:MAG: hypothetical protein LUH15_04200 [Tannerellaceae bacterium]|nr:hypothetical protein [Tannerellaceae bacterium]
MNLSGTIHHFNTLIGNIEEISAEISSEGKLVLEIPLLHAIAVYFNTPYFNERMYILPGEESTLTINLPEKPVQNPVITKTKRQQEISINSPVPWQD